VADTPTLINMIIAVCLLVLLILEVIVYVNLTRTNENNVQFNRTFSERLDNMYNSQREYNTNFDQRVSDVIPFFNNNLQEFRKRFQLEKPVEKLLSVQEHERLDMGRFEYIGSRTCIICIAYKLPMATVIQAAKSIYPDALCFSYTHDGGIPIQSYISSIQTTIGIMKSPIHWMIDIVEVRMEDIEKYAQFLI